MPTSLATLPQVFLSFIFMVRKHVNLTNSEYIVLFYVDESDIEPIEITEDNCSQKNDIRKAISVQGAEIPKH